MKQMQFIELNIKTTTNKFGCTLFTVLRKSSSCFQYPKKSLIKSLLQSSHTRKKYLPNFPTQKISQNRKFQTQKNPLGMWSTPLHMWSTPLGMGSTPLGMWSTPLGMGWLKDYVGKNIYIELKWLTMAYSKLCFFDESILCSYSISTDWNKTNAQSL